MVPVRCNFERYGTRMFSGPVGVVGSGVIGAGWAVRALSMGADVVCTDPAPDAEASLWRFVERAWPAVEQLGLAPGASPDRLRFVSDIASLADVAFVQENVPERLQLKQAVLADLDAVVAPEVIIASSTSGLLPTDLQAACRHPERVVVGHPFNPVYLLPLVEVVGGEATSDETVAGAVAHYEALGMHPLVVRNEIEGFLSDRLQEALWREILHLVADGIATTDELDRAITYGPGLRWAGMGTNLTFHLAGGAGGMRHMLEQFGPALELPWTHLKAPELTTELIDRMVEGTRAQAGERTIAELEDLRDRYLVEIMQALQPLNMAAGRALTERRRRIAGEAASASTAVPPIQPRRAITGMSAILLPHRDGHTVDWDSFDAHVERTLAAGLTPAVNMDTGYIQLLDEPTRLEVLARTAGIAGSHFVAGAFVADTPGAAFDAQGYARAAEEITDHGGTPVIFPSHGLNDHGDEAWLDAYGRMSERLERFIGFELGRMFVPYGRIVSLDTYRGLLSLPACIGAKHSSLSRELEWQRLSLRDEVRPDFMVLTGNDLAIDMVMYGADYLLGLSTFAPDKFAERDALWEARGPGLLRAKRHPPVPRPLHLPGAGAGLPPQRGNVPGAAGVGIVGRGTRWRAGATRLRRGRSA